MVEGRFREVERGLEGFGALHRQPLTTIDGTFCS
jgi:hypothetical protein